MTSVALGGWRLAGLLRSLALGGRRALGRLLFLTLLTALVRPAVGRRLGRRLAVGDVPPATLEVDGGRADAAPDMHALAIGAGWRATVRERLNLLEIVATIVADKFIDRHSSSSPRNIRTGMRQPATGLPVCTALHPGRILHAEPVRFAQQALSICNTLRPV